MKMSSVSPAAAAAAAVCLFVAPSRSSSFIPCASLSSSRLSSRRRNLANKSAPSGEGSQLDWKNFEFSSRYYVLRK
jgi:hypothetical protein